MCIVSILCSVFPWAKPLRGVCVSCRSGGDAGVIAARAAQCPADFMVSSKQQFCRRMVLIFVCACLPVAMHTNCWWHAYSLLSCAYAVCL
jgi:hypothetical protein